MAKLSKIQYIFLIGIEELYRKVNIVLYRLNLLFSLFFRVLLWGLL